MITTNLKNVTFEWDEEDKSFLITKGERIDLRNNNTMEVRLTRPEAQSFARFVFRIVIRYFYPKKYLKK